MYANVFWLHCENVTDSPQRLSRLRRGHDEHHHAWNKQRPDQLEIFFFFFVPLLLLFITVQLVCMYCYFHACEFCGIPEPPAACLTPLKCEQPLLKDEAWISAMERATDRWIMIAVGLLYHTLLLQKQTQRPSARKKREENTHKPNVPRGEPRKTCAFTSHVFEKAE